MDIFTNIFQPLAKEDFNAPNLVYKIYWRPFEERSQGKTEQDNWRNVSFLTFETIYSYMVSQKVKKRMLKTDRYENRYTRPVDGQ